MVQLLRRRSWLVMALVLLASPSLAQQPRAARSQQSSLPSSVSSSSARRAIAATSSSPAGETSNGWGRAPAAAQGNSNRRRPSDGRQIVPLGRAPASSSVSSLPSAAGSSQQPRQSSSDRPASSSSSSASRTPSVTRRSVPSPGAAGQLQGPPSSSNGTPRRDSTSAPPAGRRVPLRPRRGSQAAAPSVPSPESSPSLTLPQGLSSGAAGTPPTTRSSPRSTSDARNANGLPLRWMSEQQNSSRVEEPPQKQGNPTAPKQGNPTAPKQGSPTAPGQDEGRNKADAARPTPISSTAEQVRAPTGAALRKVQNTEAAAEAAPEDAIGNKAADNDGGRTYEADPADTRFPRSVRFRVPEPRAAQDTSSSSPSASRINNASSSPLQPMTSADPDTTSNWQCDSAYTAIESFDFLSNLRKALDAADMAEPLMDPTIPITFLAPTNQVRTIAAGRTATGDLLEPFEL